ncbi:MAG: AAA family ATPase, partial [Proteobacteria bacterium]|nr:AAA family ATPase [Pseudomonadota bacterium]
MLRELSIQNFAIIDELSFSLGPGLNIITGETGAGKSIILDALSLILGDRSSPDFIRTEAPEARIEAVFEFDSLSPALSETLSRAGYPEGEELLIRRSISRAGKGRVFL